MKNVDIQTFVTRQTSDNVNLVDAFAFDPKVNLFVPKELSRFKICIAKVSAYFLKVQAF